MPANVEMNSVILSHCHRKRFGSDGTIESRLLRMSDMRSREGERNLQQARGCEN